MQQAAYDAEIRAHAAGKLGFTHFGSVHYLGELQSQHRLVGPHGGGIELPLFSQVILESGSNMSSSELARHN